MRTETVIHGRAALKRLLLNLCPAVFACIYALLAAEAAPLQTARVSQVVHDVSLLRPNATASPAALNDEVSLGTAVRTGGQSRAELTFNDLTVTRLGENTIFSLNEGTRTVHVEHGSILLEVPPGAASAKIISSVATAAVSGGTAMFGSGPPAKFMVLEGVGTFYPAGHPEEAVTLHGGEMMTFSADGHPVVGKFDVKAVMATSHLIIDFPELTNLPLILQVIEEQTSQFLTGGPTPPTLTDFTDVISQNVAANPTVTPTASVPPTPTPSESGTPSVISTPNPYVITSGTTITTDPSITTNGVTEFGKIYGGPSVDGAFTLWGFGSTSAFDTALNLDTQFFADPNHLPIAVFKFQSLLITGNPTVNTTNGVTHLGLIGVDGIKTGPPGGTLTFAGLDLLALATVNGPINLTSDVSFQGLGTLAIYARGAGSDLTINSPMSNIGDLKIAAENSIQFTQPGTMSVGQFDGTAGNDFTLQIGGSLSLNGEMRLETFVLPGITIPTGGNLTLNIATDYTNSSLTDFSRLRVKNQGHIGSGGNLWMTVMGNVTTTGPGSTTESPEPGDLVLTVQNTNAQIDNGGNLNLNVGGNVNINGLDAEIQNSDDSPSGHIGTGGNIDLEIGGNLTTNHYLDVFLNNRDGGMIDSGGNLTLNVAGAIAVNAGSLITSINNNRGGSIGSNVNLLITAGGDLNTQGNATFQIDNSEGGHIGQAAKISLDAGSLSIGGFLTALINNRDAGSIGSSAQVLLNVSGALTTGGDATIGITNRNDGAGGGTINGDATVNVQANSVAIGGYLASFVSANGGQINGKGSLLFNVTGDITSGTGTEFDVQSNAFNGDDGPLTPGVITSDAILSVTAADLTSGGFIYSEISNNAGGHIGGNATLTLSMSGDINGQEGIAALIADTSFSPNIGQSRIEGNATVTLQATNIITPSNASGTIGIDTMALEASIYTNVNGFVGGDAMVDVAASQDISAGGTALFWIANGNYQGLGAGTINGNAEVSVNAANISTGDFYLRIENFGGSSIGKAATLSLQTVALSSSGNFDAQIDNFNGGLINLYASVSVQATSNPGGLPFSTEVAQAAENSGLSVPNGTATFYIDNAGGTIGSVANINVIADSISTDVNVALNSLFVRIDNPGGLIGDGATVSLSIAGNVTSGEFVEDIENYNGGLIGLAADVEFHVGGTLSATGKAFFDIFNQSGTIGSNAIINASAVGISTTDDLVFGINNQQSGTIGNDASITLNANGAVNSGGGTTFFTISNNPGDIGGNATIDVTAASASGQGFVTLIHNDGGGLIGNNATMSLTLSGNLSVSSGGLFMQIFNSAGGEIGENAMISVNTSGDLNSSGIAVFHIYNNDTGSGGGDIGTDAAINVSAANILGAPLEVAISNEGGNIGGAASIDFTASANTTVTGSALFAINNGFGSGEGSGAIGGNATINLNTTDISADSLQVNIDNTGGSISGNATINMNVGGTATVTNDANIQILGNDPAGAAAINFNHGSYDVGGTFRSTIDGSGTITFNNANVHADTVLAGVFGPNGALIIGGSGSKTISANTLLDLYAPGSNGTLKFVSNVTLSSGTVMNLAANTITILPSVVVDIEGNGGPANIFTNNPNYNFTPGPSYTGPAPNPSNGSFGGLGAQDPQPLANAPPFGGSPPVAPAADSTTSTASPAAPSSPAPTVASSGGHGGVGGAPQPSSRANGQVSSQTVNATSRSSNNMRVGSRNATDAGIEVGNSGQLLSLLNTATRGADGKITLPATNLQGINSTRGSAGGRLRSNSNSRVTAQAVAEKATTGAQPGGLPRIQ